MEKERQSKLDLKNIKEYEKYFDESNLSTISKLDTFAKHVEDKGYQNF